jgi:hypothetical protein
MPQTNFTQPDGPNDCLTACRKAVYRQLLGNPLHTTECLDITLTQKPKLPKTRKYLIISHKARRGWVRRIWLIRLRMDNNTEHRLARLPEQPASNRESH